MLSIVNYGSSDSENEISDEEDEISSKVINKIVETDDDLIHKTSKIHLPERSTNKSIIEEEDDEFLHKKAVPTVAPPKAKVKIMIPRLSDFKDEEDKDEKLSLKMQPANKKSGLLGMLPKPSQSFAPAPRPASATVSKNPPTTMVTSTKSSQDPLADAPKKVGLIPYALMSHKPKAQDSKKPEKKKEEGSDDDDDDQVGSYFTFASQDDELPQVNEEETKALIAKETARMEQRKRQNEEVEPDQIEDESLALHEEQQRQQMLDEEAMKALMGGNKAKRSKMDNIQIIDLSAAEVMPNRQEWIRKTLAGETSYQPTGNLIDKVRNIQRFKKLQFVNILPSFRDRRRWLSGSIKSPTSRCEQRTTKQNWKRCGLQVALLNVKENPSTDFKIKSEIIIRFIFQLFQPETQSFRNIFITRKKFEERIK